MGIITEEVRKKGCAAARIVNIGNKYTKGRKQPQEEIDKRMKTIAEKGIKVGRPKGTHPITEFKKGAIPWNKGIKTGKSSGMLGKTKDKYPELFKKIGFQKGHKGYLTGETYRKMMSKKGINKKEQYLLDIIKNNSFPYTYTGSNKNCKRIANKVPDFIHNSDNKIIELFGEYWHPKSDEEKRIKYFEANGYKCLVIWVKELKNKNALIKKIEGF